MGLGRAYVAVTTDVASDEDEWSERPGGGTCDGIIFRFSMPLPPQLPSSLKPEVRLNVRSVVGGVRSAEYQAADDGSDAAIATTKMTTTSVRQKEAGERYLGNVLSASAYLYLYIVYVAYFSSSWGRYSGARQIAG